MKALRALVIDDEKALLSILQRVLDHMDCQMVGASTLRDGLKCAQAGDFDIILLDNHFPEGHCDSIVPALLAGSPGTPIVIITANPEDEHVARALDFGVREAVGKPFSMVQLAQILERYCGAPVRGADQVRVA